MMKLYTGPLSMFGAKVQIAALENGLEHDMGSDAAIAACHACAKFYVELDASLVDRDYLSSTYSFADIAFYMAQVFAERKGAVMTLATPTLLVWCERVGARAAVREVVGPMMGFLKTNGRPVPGYLQGVVV